MEQGFKGETSTKEPNNTLWGGCVKLKEAFYMPLKHGNELLLDSKVPKKKHEKLVTNSNRIFKRNVLVFWPEEWTKKFT